MGKGHEVKAETAERILEAATEVFAEKGFKAATTRMIAARAGVNIASLHYHFRDKRGVYMAAFESHADYLIREVPMPELRLEKASHGKRLKAIIDLIVHRVMLKDAAPIWQLTIKELLEPQGAADIIAEKIARPQFKMLSSAVAGLLGPKASAEDARLCSLSVISQIIALRLARPVFERVVPEQRYTPEAAERLSKHIQTFSLDAIKARRKSLEKEDGK